MSLVNVDHHRLKQLLMLPPDDKRTVPGQDRLIACCEVLERVQSDACVKRHQLCAGTTAECIPNATMDLEG
jgi:hypothetical protein